MKKVLCILPVEQRHKEKLEKAGAGCEFVYESIKTVTEEQIAQANYILGNVPAAKIKASEKLEFLQLNSAGADEYIKPGILAEKTVLANSTGAYSKAVAEHALALTLMLQKKLHLYRDAQLKNCWTDEGTVVSIADSTVVIVGLGDIGCHYAKLVKSLGAYTIGVKRRASDKPDEVDELYTTEQLDEALKRADVVLSVLPGTKQTHHLYTREKFELMKNSAVFINCGRGSAIESSMLAEVLNDGLIAAAAVDVTEIEPLPAESELWSVRNLVITPHVSGFYHLPETFERVVDIAAKNLSACVNGKEPMNIVDFTTGYKK